MDDKLQAQYSETATDRYEGLRPEDAECLRQYEGKAGKKVVRKVRSSCYKIDSTSFRLTCQPYRLTSGSSLS